MTKYYLVLFALMYVCGLKAQIINFPDIVFKNALLQPNSCAARDLNLECTTIDINGDGEIQESEAAQIGAIDLYNFSNISDLSGIEYFTNLIQLDCSNNQLTSLSITTLSNLNTIGCANNNIHTLNIIGPAITILDCGNNNITSLNLDGLPNLEYLACSFNELTALNFPGHNLNMLYCAGNSLTSLDVHNMTNLEVLNCFDNFLTTLDVANSGLRYLDCANNHLESLNLSGLSDLTDLWCEGNLLSALNFNDTIDLINLDIENNLLTSVNVSNLNNLAYFSCSHNMLTSLTVSSQHLQALDCSYNQITSLNDLTPSVNSLFLNCSNNQLTGLSLNSDIRDLNCSHNQITNISFQDISKLQSIDCSYNNLQHLDLSDYSWPYALSMPGRIYCSNNQLVSINMQNTWLQTDVDFSDNPGLQTICTDGGEEREYIQNLIDQYGYVNCDVSACGLGTDDINSSAMYVYPNPASLFINIANPNNYNLESIHIYNVLGETVYTRSDFNSSDILDISQLSSGPYFMKINYGEETTVFKFIKL